MTRPTAAADAAQIAIIFDLLERSASADYIGEGVSQLEHALQAAALARAANAASNEVLAALLHDIGHLCAKPDAARMSGLGVLHHEDIGADFLAAHGLHASVTEVVRGHVAAKRYQVGSDASYYDRLSDASRVTLTHQGGAMDDAERRAFEALPIHRALLRVRAWDERAKDPGRQVEGLAFYEPLLRDHLRNG